MSAGSFVSTFTLGRASHVPRSCRVNTGLGRLSVSVFVPSGATVMVALSAMGVVGAVF